MEQTTALQQIISVPVLSKEAQSDLAKDLIAQVINGDVNPIHAFVKMKALGEVIEQFIKDPDVLAATQEEISKTGKSAMFAGAKVAISNITRYDYASSDDHEYAEPMRQKESIDTKLKAHQMFLKSISGTIEVVDPETGELVTISAPIPTVSSTVKVTFAKQ